MKPEPWSMEEVEDAWALGLSLDAGLVPEPELERALAAGRVQVASFSSSMGTAETGWLRASPTHLEWAREDGAVVPPGQTAEDTPYNDYADDRDVDGLLWAPFRAAQFACLAANTPEARIPIAIAECMRVHAVLDAKFGAKPGEPPDTYERTLAQVRRRIESFSWDTLDRSKLRNALLRVLVAIAWDRPWTPVDVDAAWKPQR